jgi:hypothetical protein
MPSKAHQRFDNRIRDFDADLELADLLLRKFLEMPSGNGSVCEAMGGKPKTYPRLHRRVNSSQSRKITGLHLKRMLCVAFIKDLHEDFSEYISTSLARAALAGVDPGRFAGEVKLDISAAEILRAGSWPEVVRLISDKIFRALENERSTEKLIMKVSARIGLGLERPLLAEAMPYLDARHILVHRDGRTDELYRTSYPNIPLDGESILVNFDFVDRARTRVKALARHIDEKMIAANLVRPEDMTGVRNAAAPARPARFRRARPAAEPPRPAA